MCNAQNPPPPQTGTGSRHPLMTWNSIATTACLRDSSVRETLQENNSNDLRFCANCAKFPQACGLQFRAKTASTLSVLHFDFSKTFSVHGEVLRLLKAGMKPRRST